MRIAALVFCWPLGGCLVGDKIADEHWLWPSEREALRRSFSLALNDADTTQIKWMRVIEWLDRGQSGGPVHYCGLINGKTSADTFSGFHVFAADIKKNANGAYDEGEIRYAEGDLSVFRTSARINDRPAHDTTQQLCKYWSYSDFSQSD